MDLRYHPITCKMSSPPKLSITLLNSVYRVINSSNTAPLLNFHVGASLSYPIIKSNFPAHQRMIVADYTASPPIQSQSTDIYGIITTQTVDMKTYAMKILVDSLKKSLLPSTLVIVQQTSMLTDKCLIDAGFEVQSHIFTPETEFMPRCGVKDHYFVTEDNPETPLEN